MRSRFSSTIAALLLGLVVGLVGWIGPLPTKAVTPTLVSTELDPGWNLIAWTQDEAPVDVLFDALHGAAIAVYGWDADGQRFRYASRRGPAFLDDLESLQLAQGFWVLIEAEQSVRWTRLVQTLTEPPELRPGQLLTLCVIREMRRCRSESPSTPEISSATRAEPSLPTPGISYSSIAL